ncbi:hypothetical protein [Streptomyces sp. NBC_01216]|uniref:hypothetical protein n=1 Tax=unclassified Streptomyces TaxID=2593676 RepID=UPI002E16581D|nr:hypothetical protein OG393_31795 [Streptomyces sp. NBC_01216]
MSVLRWVTGGLGLVLVGIGAWLIVTQPAPWEVLVWMAGALVLHDGIVAPLVLAVGLVLLGRRERGLLRGALIVGGGVVFVTLPVLLRPGPAPNPSALPLPYGRNLVIVLAAVAVATGALFLVRRRWQWWEAWQVWLRGRAASDD